MEIRIAVASSDGKTVDEHFGQARSFRIYRLHDEGYELLEMRDNASGHASHYTALKDAAHCISDCRGVVASEISSGGFDSLFKHQIMALTLPGTIDEALHALIREKPFIAAVV